MRTAILVMLSLLAGFAVNRAAAEDTITTVETDTAFADVMTDLQDAIINRGYVIDYHSHIGEMLSRTAGDVGADKQVYKNAEFLQFCSAVLSRAAMEADIGNIAYCPYILFAYEPAAYPGKVTVGFRRLPPGDGRDQVNETLNEILHDAAGQ
ncbi:hypothetical protein HDIA_3901 [Hartmannibacter diazotrophicus]|uniref:DUF302 domain-containing protein n=1 Tax=Hartmannibacter diazotrophicus TaxID=1482074 RepID=A0A2C9DAU0_9HYPH|nr:DUF302 domain-containing protein [Hartmannibacter diazotrophicus]SON57442.1 hypothetical protein HDIA_3901 [Hartmannibacter diazotrophicus]